MARLRYVQGLDRVDRVLKSIPERMREKIEAALDKGAAEIERDAKTLVPKVTHELEGAIEVRKSLKGFVATGAVANVARLGATGPTGLTRFIGVYPARRGAPGWYAAWVEFGTKDTPAQPFLLPAWRANRKRVVARVRRAIRTAAKEMARAAKRP